MATRAEILAILEELLAAYPNQRGGRGMPVFYTDYLQDIPGEVLAAAAAEHTRQRPWFPHIAELRLGAARLAGVMIFAEGQEADLSGRQLFGMELVLHREYRHGEGLDGLMWERLIASYAQIGWEGEAQRARSWLERVIPFPGN